MHESYKKWLDEGCPKVICSCGCNGEIIIQNWHKYTGIPKYIHGHNSIGENNPNLGKHPSEETKQKIREKHLGKHHTQESKQKIKDNHVDMSGENHPNWKGGMTSLNKIIRNCEHYNEWRLQIFGRDNFTCKHCGIRGVYLEVHHIKPLNVILKEYNIKTLDDALKCEILWDLNNGVTYCLECHEKLKKKGGKLENLPRFQYFSH